MSNEPGFYEVGSYGIRLESVVVVKEVSTRRGFGDQRWFGFERFTQVRLAVFSPLVESLLHRDWWLTRALQVPIQTTMVEWKLLSPDEREWLRRHNEGCKNALLDLVKDDKRAVRYLKKNA